MKIALTLCIVYDTMMVRRRGEQMKKWQVLLYETEGGDVPVEKFLIALPPKHKAKALWEIGLLEELGTTLREPYAKSIQGKKYKGLFELRVEMSGDISRIFYFLPAGEKFILLHGFIKKSQKTPPSELEIALQRMNDYKRRFVDDE